MKQPTRKPVEGQTAMAEEAKDGPRWFLIRNGRELGPYFKEEIKARAEAGEIGMFDLVVPAGEEGPRKLLDVKTLIHDEKPDKSAKGSVSAIRDMPRFKGLFADSSEKLQPSNLAKDKDQEDSEKVGREEAAAPANQDHQEQRTARANEEFSTWEPPKIQESTPSIPPPASEPKAIRAESLTVLPQPSDLSGKGQGDQPKENALEPIDLRTDMPSGQETPPPPIEIAESHRSTPNSEKPQDTENAAHDEPWIPPTPKQPTNLEYRKPTSQRVVSDEERDTGLAPPSRESRDTEQILLLPPAHSEQGPQKPLPPQTEQQERQTVPSIIDSQDTSGIASKILDELTGLPKNITPQVPLDESKNHVPNSAFDSIDFDPPNEEALAFESLPPTIPGAATIETGLSQDDEPDSPSLEEGPSGTKVESIEGAPKPKNKNDLEEAEITPPRPLIPDQTPIKYDSSAPTNFTPHADAAEEGASAITEQYESESGTSEDPSPYPFERKSEKRIVAHPEAMPPIRLPGTSYGHLAHRAAQLESTQRQSNQDKTYSPEAAEHHSSSGDGSRYFYVYDRSGEKLGLFRASQIYRYYKAGTIGSKCMVRKKTSQKTITVKQFVKHFSQQEKQRQGLEMGAQRSFPLWPIHIAITLAVLYFAADALLDYMDNQRTVKSIETPDEQPTN